MIALFCLLLLCISMPMTVKSETCGGSSGPPCNISVVNEPTGVTAQKQEEIIFLRKYLFCSFRLYYSDTKYTYGHYTCGIGKTRNGDVPSQDQLNVYSASVFAAFQNAHLVAITPNWEFDLCIILVPHENFNGTTITAYYRNGTLGSQNKETYTFTDEPDVVNMTLSNDPSILYQFRMLYADLEACFIVNFIPESIGCRLWIFNGATSEQITACSEAHAQICSGTLHDTWDEDSCDRLLKSA